MPVAARGRASRDDLPVLRPDDADRDEERKPPGGSTRGGWGDWRHRSSAARHAFGQHTRCLAVLAAAAALLVVWCAHSARAKADYQQRC